MNKLNKVQAIKSGITMAKGAHPKSTNYVGIKAFVGWAYAHGHNIPMTDDELDAMLLMLETVLENPKEWIPRYLPAFNEMRGKRAKRWRILFKALWTAIPPVPSRPLYAAAIWTGDSAEAMAAGHQHHKLIERWWK